MTRYSHFFIFWSFEVQLKRSEQLWEKSNQPWNMAFQNDTHFYNKLDRRTQAYLLSLFFVQFCLGILRINSCTLWGCQRNYIRFHTYSMNRKIMQLEPNSKHFNEITFSKHHIPGFKTNIPAFCGLIYCKKCVYHRGKSYFTVDCSSPIIV